MRVWYGAGVPFLPETVAKRALRLLEKRGVIGEDDPTGRAVTKTTKISAGSVTLDTILKRYAELRN